MKISIKSFVSAILTVVTITIVFSSCGKKADTAKYSDHTDSVITKDTVKHSDYVDFVITRTTDDWDLDISFDSKTGEYYGSNGNYIIRLSGIAKTSIKEHIKKLESSYGTNKIYDFMAPWKDVYETTPHKYVFSLSYYVAGEEQNITVVYDNYNYDKSPDRRIIDKLEYIEAILYYEAESYKVTHNAAGEEIKNYDEIISYRIENNDFICDGTTISYGVSHKVEYALDEMTKYQILSYLYDFNISQYDESPIVKENEYFIVTVKTDKWEKTVSWTLDPTIPVDEGGHFTYMDERFYNDVNYGKTRWVCWLEERFGPNRLRSNKFVMY